MVLAAVAMALAACSDGAEPTPAAEPSPVATPAPEPEACDAPRPPLAEVGVVTIHGATADPRALFS